MTPSPGQGNVPTDLGSIALKLSEASKLVGGNQRIVLRPRGSQPATYTHEFYTRLASSVMLEEGNTLLRLVLEDQLLSGVTYDFEFPAIPFLTDTAGNRLQVPEEWSFETSGLSAAQEAAIGGESLEAPPSQVPLIIGASAG